MDPTTLMFVTAGVLLGSIILLTSLCINCQKRSRQTTISENYAYASGDYQGVEGQTKSQRYPISTSFGIVRPGHSLGPPPIMTQNTLPPQNSHLTSPVMPAPRRVSYCRSEDGVSHVSNMSNDDYKNVEPDCDPSSARDYIVVLPETSLPQGHSVQSVASSQNSVGQDYINVEGNGESNQSLQGDNKSDDDDDDYEANYENVQKERSLTPAASMGSMDSAEGDYVNAPSQAPIHLTGKDWGY